MSTKDINPLIEKRLSSINSLKHQQDALFKQEESERKELFAIMRSSGMMKLDTKSSGKVALYPNKVSYKIPLDLGTKINFFDTLKANLSETEYLSNLTYNKLGTTVESLKRKGIELPVQAIEPKEEYRLTFWKSKLD